MASELIMHVNHSVGDSYPNSQQPENITGSSVVPETDHRGETKAHEEHGSERQQPGAGGAGVVGSGEKGRQEEENDREFSETIERLDSVLLEAGGNTIEPLDKASAPGGAITEAEGEGTLLQPQGETQKFLEEVMVPLLGRESQTSATESLVSQEKVAETLGESTASGEETPELVGQTVVVEIRDEAMTPMSREVKPKSVGETLVPFPGGASKESAGPTIASGGEQSTEERTVQVILGKTSESLVEMLVPTGETSESLGETLVSRGEVLLVPIGETSESLVEMLVPLGEASESRGETSRSLEGTSASVGETSWLVSGREISELEVMVQLSPTETPEPISHHVAGELADQSPNQVTSEGADRVYENIPPLLAQETASWIDTLVRNIVTEVAAEGLGGEASRALSDNSSEQREKGAEVPADGEQVSLEERVCQAQVAPDNSDLTVQVCEGEAGSSAQVSAVRVAESLVTPDPVSVPGREGTSDPGQPTACREKERPPLICSVSEVRADTADQGHTQSGTREATPAMKDWETVGEVVTPTPETPIEREIRLAMEREMMLRQERGITVPSGEPELVEVRRRTVAAESVVQPGKERQLAGAQMQREILLETQRERDLVEQGKVMGAYDRGDQQELYEKKMMFESLKTEPSDTPLKKRQSELQKSLSVDGPVVVVVPIESNHVAPAPSAEVKKGPSYAEANGSNIIILEHGSLLRRSAASVVSSPAPEEPFRPSPAEFRRSTPTDLSLSRSSSQSSPLPNPNPESPASVPISPFQVLRSPSPRSLLEREIEEVQQREQELIRQRTSIYGKDHSVEENSHKAPENREDILSGVYQPERPSWGRLEVNWPPNRSSAVNGQEQASDSPRTRRQRSALIKSWESGNPSPRDED